MATVSNAPLRPREIQTKVHQYQQFVEKTLKRDLAAVTQQLDKIQQKHTDYSALKQTLQSLQTQHEAELAANPDQPIQRMKSMINLGSEFYVKAVVPDPTRLFLDVGLGFHVELTLSEAITFIDTKLPTLDTKIGHLKGQIAMIQGKIKVVYEGIAELMQLQPVEKPQRQFF